MAITTFRIKVGDRWFIVQVGDLSHSPFEVIVDGEAFQIEVEGLPQPPARPRRGRSSSPDIEAPSPQRSPAAFLPPDNIIRSPMPGRVISILVRPGDRVSTGDEVCVVEAMKMEQSIRAHQDGVVKTVHVEPMDTVSADDPLIELE